MLLLDLFSCLWLYTIVSIYYCRYEHPLHVLVLDTPPLILMCDNGQLFLIYPNHMVTTANNSQSGEATQYLIPRDGT